MHKIQVFKLKSTKGQGFALWDTLLLVALVAALLVVAFVSQQSRMHWHQAQDQDATLLWADQQVAGFAVSHLRLPCPDINDDGLEDCGAGSLSGLLPVKTLGLKADAATRGPVRILYDMLRPGSMDPALLESYFEPQKWDGSKYSYGTANGLDFCGKLADIVSGNPSAVAYTVGLKRRDGETDLQRSHSASDLSNSLSCITTMSSVNGIALAVDVVNEVLDQQSSTKDAAVITIAFNILHIALTGIDVALAAIGMAASVTALGVASGLLAGAIASCVVLVGCALIPVYTAAVVAAGVAIGLFATAIALGAVAIATLVASTALAIDVAIKTGNDPGDQTLDVDLDQVKDAAQAAADKATEEENKLNNLRNQRDAAYNAQLAAYNQVYNLANGQHAADVNAAVSAARALDNAQLVYDQAKGERDEASKRVNDLNDALTYQQNECANANLPDEQYKCDTVPRIQDRIAQAQQDLASKQSALNNATTQLNDATAAYNTAWDKVRNDFGEVGFCWLFPVEVSCAIDDYRSKYLKWKKAVAAYDGQVQIAADARTSANQAWDAYVQMRDGNTPGNTGSGSAITVWAGAEAILKQADANGVVE